ncbi:MAG: DUF6384 family protein [Pseudomonadota bacterium]
MSEATESPSGADAPLDDVMLAMDVVDTLRRRERLVTRELNDAGREADLSARLKEIYAQQGITVPDHVIEQGVRALREDRFVYRPPDGGIRRRLWLWYTKRDKWGKWVAGAIGVLVVFLGIRFFTVVAPEAALPDDLAETHQAAMSLAKSDTAKKLADDLMAQGSAAIAEDDPDGARGAMKRLRELSDLLQTRFQLQIVNRPGERSGVFRIPDVNTQARNHYVIVEAISPDGDALTVPVKNEETGKTERVTQWGIRVDARTFEAIRNDKSDNGIIDNNIVGTKDVGFVKPTYRIKTQGGSITRW